MRYDHLTLLPESAFKGLGKHMRLWGKGSDAPPAPDYTGAAQATAAGNLDAARATSAANKINQVTPYGNLSYSINGKDSYGNDLYTATQSLAPAQQALLNQQNSISSGLLNSGMNALPYINQALSNPLTMANLPASMVNPGQTGQDAIMARLNPQYDRLQNNLNNSLANQGITQGSEAWKNAQNDFGYQRNDAYQQAALNGINVGENAQNQQFQLQNALQNQPINLVNALRTGSQVQNPSFVNPSQQAQTAGADYTGAAQNTYNANLSAANAANASDNSLTSGLFSLGSGALMYY